MTGWIDWLRKLGGRQWLALIVLLFAYAVIAMPFLGLPWKRANDFSFLLVLPGSILLLIEGRWGIATKSGPSGFSHLGRTAMVMMLLWGQPWWPVPRPQQPDDFWVFVWPFLIVVNATRILLAEAPDPDSAALDEEPRLA